MFTIPKTILTNIADRYTPAEETVKQIDIKFAEEFGNYLVKHPINRDDAGNLEQLTLRELFERGELLRSRLVEVSLQLTSNERYVLVNKQSNDFSDKSDAKSAISVIRRNNITDVTHSVFVHGLSNKIGGLRIVVYNRVTTEFEFFAIPHSAYSGKSDIELTYNSIRNCNNINAFSTLSSPKPGFKKNGLKRKFFRYQVDSFEELANYEF